ncbi:hypothetical protein [Roseibacillus persicicus]
MGDRFFFLELQESDVKVPLPFQVLKVNPTIPQSALSFLESLF